MRKGMRETDTKKATETPVMQAHGTTTSTITPTTINALNLGGQFDKLVGLCICVVPKEVARVSVNVELFED